MTKYAVLSLGIAVAAGIAGCNQRREVAMTEVDKDKAVEQEPKQKEPRKQEEQPGKKVQSRQGDYKHAFPDPHDPAVWDKMAADYEAKAHPFTSLYAKAMLSRLKVGPGIRFLDVATGTGAAAFPAAEAGADVVAIDFSEGMVQRLRAHKVRNIDARKMDGQALDLPDASFDVVVSAFGVMLFPDWRKGLREMARVTKPGGTAAVLTWRDPDGAAIGQLMSKVCRDLFPDLKFPPHPAGMVELSDPQRLAKAMVAAGFETPTVETLKEKYKFNVEKLFDSNPWSSRLDATQQKAVIEEVRRRFGQNRDGEDLFIESEALLARAKRGDPKHAFADPEERAKKWNDPERDKWQHPEEIVVALALKPGTTVADIGAGTVYMVAHLSKAVGKGGTIIAVDASAAMVDYLAKRSAELGPAKIVPRKVGPDDPELEAASADRVLMLDTWHHVKGQEAYAKKVYEGLKRGGRFVVVEYKVDAEIGPPKAMRLAPAAVTKQLEAAGFRVEVVRGSMPRHYMVVGHKD